MKTGKFSTVVQQLINDIVHCPEMNNSVLTALLSEKSFSGNDFNKYETFDHPICQSYGRQLIYDHGSFKILLMSWAPGDFTAIHNHGYTEWGCVCFFGDATHRMFCNADDQLKISQSDVFTDGFIAPVCGDLIHLMGNAGKKGFTTLHIYGSNTRADNISQNSNIFLPEHGLIVSTMGSAYLEPEQNLITNQHTFDCRNPELLKDYFSLVRPFYRRNNRISVLEKIDAVL